MSRPVATGGCRRAVAQPRNAVCPDCNRARSGACCPRFAWPPIICVATTAAPLLQFSAHQTSVSRTQKTSAASSTALCTGHAHRWFNEQLDPAVLDAAEKATAACDLFITAGTSAVVYPAGGCRVQGWGRGAAIACISTSTRRSPSAVAGAGPKPLTLPTLLLPRSSLPSPAGFAQAAAANGATVAEFNLEATAHATFCKFALQGKAGDLLPAAFGVEAQVEAAMQAQQAASQQQPCKSVG